jgi:hypothetical protein
MHQYKTIVQILLVLSILNFAFPAPIPRHIISRDIMGETTPLPSDELPPDNSLPLEGSVPSSHLPATEGQLPTTEASTPAAADTRPVPMQGSTAGVSTTGRYTAVTPEMVTKKKPYMSKETMKSLGRFGLYLGSVAAATAAMVKFATWMWPENEND